MDILADRLKNIPTYLFMQLRDKIRKAQAEGVDLISLAIGTRSSRHRRTSSKRCGRPCSIRRTTSIRRTSTEACAFFGMRFRAGTEGSMRCSSIRDRGARPERLEGRHPSFHHGHRQPRRHRDRHGPRVPGLPGEHPDGWRRGLRGPAAREERVPACLRGDPGNGLPEDKGLFPQLPQQPDGRLRGQGLLHAAGGLGEDARHPADERQSLQRDRLFTRAATEPHAGPQAPRTVVWSSTPSARPTI